MTAPWLDDEDDEESTTVNAADVTRVMRLFEGYGEAYGSYDAAQSAVTEPGVKQEIKKTARTVRARVDRSLWEDHLEGRHPLGVIPIRDNDTCVWGAIDVDQYDLILSEVAKNIDKARLPLMACRTKSGGVHLFLFLNVPVPAAIVRARLQEMAVLLGYGNSEIFPKQKTVDLERGDLGSWLNMPYFNSRNTDRYAFRPNGLPMSIAEFLDHAEGLRQPESFLEKDHRVKTEKNVEFGDGPPCMQHMAAVGVPDGARNKGLFAMAIYAKKKYGARWADVIEEWNRLYVSPPLPASEVMAIIKGHEKKEYNYTCREFPLSAHCNSALCRTRRYGVGGDSEYPIIGNLRVLGTDPPVWFLEVNDNCLELSTDQLLRYPNFQKACAEKLHVYFRGIKSEDWVRAVGAAMKEVVKMDAPSEIGQIGEFLELLEEFCTNRHRGERPEDLLLGRPWDCPDRDKYFFRLRDLQKFLDLNNFRFYTRAQIATRLRGIGGGREFYNIKGRGVNAWWVPRKYETTTTLELPPLEEEPI